MNRETLLGYLMNALEDSEMSSIERELLRQPELRKQLAEIQQEISPLACVGESSEPPHQLARRTCDKIWAVKDKEELYRSERGTPVTDASQSAFVSMPVLPFQERVPRRVSEHSQMLQEILAVSSAIPPQENNTGEFPFRRLKRNFLQQAAQKPIQRVRRRLDVLAALTTGILLAVVVFHGINRGTGQNPESFTAHQIAEYEPMAEEMLPEIAIPDMPVANVSSGTDFVPFSVQTQGRDIILGRAAAPLPSLGGIETRSGWQNISFSTPDVANQTRIFIGR